MLFFGWKLPKQEQQATTRKQYASVTSHLNKDLFLTLYLAPQEAKGLVCVSLVWV